MPTVNIREAKAHLPKLIDRASKGESFIIVKAGRPVATVSAIGPPKPTTRLGFLAGEIAVPEDFDRMGGERTARLAPRRAR